MVSLRCKMLVQAELCNLAIAYNLLELGIVELKEPISTEQREILKSNLLKSGLELLDDKKSILVERIKNTITEVIHHSDELPRVNFSIYLSHKLGYDYTYLSNVFTEIKGTTIQQYVIINKIEKVKELILYDELNLSEIAHKMHYSSVAHLSNQFKKIAGMTPTFYRQLKLKREGNLENL